MDIVDGLDSWDQVAGFALLLNHAVDVGRALLLALRQLVEDRLHKASHPRHVSKGEPDTHQATSATLPTRQSTLHDTTASVPKCIGPVE